jgi:hypothetical protein
MTSGRSRRKRRRNRTRRERKKQGLPREGEKGRGETQINPTTSSL